MTDKELQAIKDNSRKLLHNIAEKLLQWVVKWEKQVDTHKEIIKEYGEKLWWVLIISCVESITNVINNNK